MKKEKVAVFYGRFSSNNQREESIDAQRRAVYEYAKSNRIRILRDYTDRAKSATTDDRPAFLQMVEDSKDGEFEIVIVHKLDRFSRDRYDSAVYKRRLRKNGVVIMSVLENLDGSPESVMMESLIEGMAEYYSKNLAREVKKGLKENALKCIHTGGKPPLGYDVDSDTKKYIINDTEAGAVKIIFERYVKGHGYAAIISELNERGYKTKCGKTFGKNSLYEILRNEKYAGVYIFNRSPGKDVSGKRNNHASKDAKEVIRIEGGIPAIISPELFTEAKERQDQNKQSGGANKAKEVYLLSGIIVCGECLERTGERHIMFGNSKNSGANKTKHVTYRCSVRHKDKSCDNKEVRREYIEDFVLNELESNLFNDENLSGLVQKLNDYQAKNNLQLSAEQSRIKVKMAEITKKIDHLVEAVAQGSNSRRLQATLNDLEEEKQRVEQKLDEIKNSGVGKAVDECTMRELFAMFRTFIKDRNLPEIKKFIRFYVKEVILYKDHVEVLFFLPEGTTSLPEANVEMQSEITRRHLNSMRKEA